MTPKEDSKSKLSYLISMRKTYLDKYYNSYDEINGEYTIDEPEEIDKLSEQIINKIRKDKDLLDVDFIIERLTELGDAPSILYDDNGNFAVESSGVQTVPIGEVTNIEMGFLIEKDSWFPTIRKALYYYLEQED